MELIKEKKKTVIDPACTALTTAVTDALYAIGGKWKLIIIIAIAQGNKRFNDLQRRVAGISSKVLANELKELERNGIIKRTVYNDISIIIEYEVTEYSNTLQDVVNSLSTWGNNHREKIKRELSTVHDKKQDH